MRSGRSATAVLVVAFMIAVSSAPALSVAAASLSSGPMLKHDLVASTNWSGFAVTGPSGSVSDVKGSWIVPAIQGTCPSTNQYSSHWVGIDGYNSGTVEQTGTDSDCQGGAPRYYAWYEFYPHPSFMISGLTIHPGDTMTAEAKYVSGKFVVTITDDTTGQSFSTSAKVKSAVRSSAEWITEAPSSSGGVLPLANFGTVQWGMDYTSVSSTNYATIAGVTGPIGSFANVHSITMVTSGGATKASPSALSTDGTGFTVTWVSSGP